MYHLFVLFFIQPRFIIFGRFVLLQLLNPKIVITILELDLPTVQNFIRYAHSDCTDTPLFS